MQPSQGGTPDIAALRGCAGRLVRVRLCDGTVLAGTLRTELLSEHAIAVFLYGDTLEGTTIYIDDIAEIWQIS